MNLILPTCLLINYAEWHNLKKKGGVIFMVGTVRRFRTDRLRSLRKKFKLSQSELGNLIDSSLSTVSRWEIGERTPGGEDLTKIAKTLGTTSAYLLGETDDPNPPLSAGIKEGPGTTVDAADNKSAVRGFNGRGPAPEKILAGRGLVEWLRSRGKYVSDNTIDLPVLSPELTACCGRGISILDCTSEPDETIAFERKGVGTVDDLNPPYVVHSDGHSMEGYKIHQGAKCVVNPIEEVSSGDIAFVKFGDDVMIKKVYWRRDGAELKSSDGETIIVSNEDFECGWAQILGRVMAATVTF
jgi:transcriptional regulator with XRE-family HTH domain